MRKTNRLEGGQGKQATMPTQGSAASRRTGDQGAGPLARKGVVAAAIFFLLMGIYHVDGKFLYGNDAKPNVYLSVALLSKGSLGFVAEDFPFMFFWARRVENSEVYDTFDHWDVRVSSQPYTYRQLRDAGRLTLKSRKYYLVPSKRQTADGRPIFVGTFGPGVGLVALPVFTVLHLSCGGDLGSHTTALWYGGKFVASAMVAGSAVFVFLTACLFTTIGRSVLVTAAYALGTGVWAISSQALWQHGPNEFFLAMGTFFLMRAGGNWRHAAWSGLAYSAAVACRPTSVLVAAAAGVYLLIVCVYRRRPKVLLAYVLAAVPIAVALAAYDTYYFGSPFEFGQAMGGHAVAWEKTGREELWQTPLWLGAAGLMISPSRGLLVFSPFTILSLGGLVIVWLRGRYAALRPLTVAMVGLLVIAFMWFDWWGGWCYGPRPIVDTMPFFALLLVPVIDWICRRKAVLAMFLVLVGWSVFVQFLGVYAYDMFGWNKRPIIVVYLHGKDEPIIVSTREEYVERFIPGTVRQAREGSMDIDEPAFRYRLWSVADNQIGYYIRNFDRARQVRLDTIDLWLREPCR